MAQKRHHRARHHLGRCATTLQARRVRCGLVSAADADGARAGCAGEMVFKNVELRLDVLQEELGLPLVFTRGFIQVPRPRRGIQARPRRGRCKDAALGGPRDSLQGRGTSGLRGLTRA